MPKLGRNDPCWCGSGIKFKKCHAGREDNVRPTLNEILTVSRSVMDRHQCFHPDAPHSCSGKVVKAHTVQRARLKRIARHGQVYHYLAPQQYIVRNDNQVLEELCGIGKASTITGFCAHHDKELFAPIEDSPIRITREHACLLAYRAIVRETYAKMAMLDSLDQYRSFDRGWPIEQQQSWQNMIHEQVALQKLGLGDYENSLERYKRALTSCDYSNINVYAVELDKAPDAMCCGAIAPALSFDDQVLQDFTDSSIFLDMVTLTVVANEQGGLALFTWLDDDAGASEAFMRSFHRLPLEEKPHAVLRFMFEQIENIYISPKWWDGLQDRTRAFMRKRMGSSNGDVRMTISDDGLRIIDWKTVSLSTTLI